MNKLQKLLFIYSFIFFFFSFLFLLLFHTSLLSSQTVLFYRGLFLLGITTILFLVGVTVFSFQSKSNKTYIESLIAAVIMSAAIHVSLFIVFPVTFDRSVTMFFLNSLQKSQPTQSCAGLTNEQAQQLLISDYIVKNKALDKRTHEQVLAGMIEKNGVCLQLTARGHDFIDFSNVVKNLYNIR